MQSTHIIEVRISAQFLKDSLSEQWYQVAIDYEENYEFDAEEIEDIFER